MNMKKKIMELDKIMDEYFENNEDIEQFESDAEILNELGYDLTPDDIRIINDVSYIVHKKTSEKESSNMMFR